MTENRHLTGKTMLMRLEGNTGDFTAPGQFVNIAVDGKYLRRPISVCDYDSESVTLLYDIVGDGTEAMSKWQPGMEVDTLTALGNGFDVTAVDSTTRNPLLLGGGIGIAPLYNLAKKLVERGVRPTVILGFNTAADVVWEKEFSAICPTYVSTVDGSYGTKGFVTDVVAAEKMESDYFYACGPLPMLKSLCLNFDVDGELSLDERMACGFGICMCCCIETKNGMKGVCKSGPVFKKEELIWK